MKSREKTEADGRNQFAPEFPRPPVSLTVFVRQMGIKPITAWRWRRDGKLRTINICGRQYVPAEEIVTFNARAAAGEFQKEHKTPGKRLKACAADHGGPASPRRHAA